MSECVALRHATDGIEIDASGWLFQELQFYSGATAAKSGGRVLL